MALTGPGKTEQGNQTYDTPPVSGRKAARMAQRGGSAVAATSSRPRAGRVATVRGGSR